MCGEALPLDYQGISQHIAGLHQQHIIFRVLLFGLGIEVQLCFLVSFLNLFVQRGQQLFTLGPATLVFNGEGLCLLTFPESLARLLIQGQLGDFPGFCRQGYLVFQVYKIRILPAAFLKLCCKRGQHG